jgi:hypothetical protein
MAKQYDSSNSSYKVSGMEGKVMGQASKPYKCDPFAAQRSDMGRLKKEPMTNRGYPRQAWDYKF